MVNYFYRNLRSWLPSSYFHSASEARENCTLYTPVELLCTVKSYRESLMQECTSSCYYSSDSLEFSCNFFALDAHHPWFSKVNNVTPCVSYFWTWILQATYDCIASSGKVFVELTINWSVLSWSAAVGPWSANLVCVTLWSDYCFLLLSFMIVFHSTLGTQRFASYSTWSVDCVHVASALLNCLTFENL